MAYGHTDDVPNTVDLEAQPTPESSAVLPEINIAQLQNLRFTLEFGKKTWTSYRELIHCISLFQSFFR
ncbi:MAG: hypothetical protein COA78_23535 [Blastopirellula sp.]|nr:MAG: hypothetical protein COA78_23535 [Blastopirellula sp.]